MPDLTKPAKKENTPEEHIKVNTFLSLMTVITCFTLAILLYSLLGFRPETPVMVYVTAGLLIAMGAWHIQSFIRSRKLKKQWALRTPKPANEGSREVDLRPAAAMLRNSPFDENMNLSITEDTTRDLREPILRSPKP